MNVSLTARGAEAAAAVRRGVASVDEQLAEKLSLEGIHALRAGLVGLIEIAQASTQPGPPDL